MTEKTVINSAEDRETFSAKFVEGPTSFRMGIIEECRPLVDWLADNYRRFGATFDLVTNQSQEGAQFCKGFDGIDGLLRYGVDFSVLSSNDETGEEFYSESDEI